MELLGSPNATLWTGGLVMCSGSRVVTGRHRHLGSRKPYETAQSLGFRWQKHLSLGCKSSKTDAILVERCRKPSKGSSSSLPSEDPLTSSHVLKIDRLRLSTYNSFCSDRGSLIAMPPPPKRNKRTGPKSYRTRGETKNARDAFGYVDGMAQNW